MTADQVPALVVEDKRGPHGKTVSLEGELRYLSVSSLQLADDSTESGCPRKWAARYILGIKEPTSDAMERGTLVHAEIEKYLGTGERGHMSAIAIAGISILPPPGPDLQLEHSLVPVNPETGEEDLRLAPLRAAGVPLIGRIDGLHSRGINYGGSDIEDTEDPPGTIEVFDHKIVKRIGRFTKTPADLPKTIQMAGYAQYVWRVHPETPYVRLSHNYIPVQGNPRKVSLRVVREQVDETWNRVEGLAGYLRDACTTRDPEQFRTNTSACMAFGRVCVFANKCSAYGANNPFARIAARAAKLVRPGAGLFGATSTPQDPPKMTQDTSNLLDLGGSPTPTAEDVAQKKRDLQIQQDAAAIRRLGFGFVTMIGQGAVDVARAENRALMTHDDKPFLGGESVLASFKINSADSLAGVLKEATANQAKLRERLAALPAAASPIPSDAPPPSPPRGPQTNYADGPAASTSNTSEAAKKAIEEQATEPKKAPKAPKATTKKVFSTKADGAAPSGIPPQPTDELQTPKLTSATSAVSTPAPAASSAITLFVDCQVIGGPQMINLADIVDGILLAINEEAGREMGKSHPVDFRLADKDGEFGFGRWKGHVANALEQTKFPGGELTYDTMGGADVASVVVDTMRKICANSGGRVVLGKKFL